MTSPVLPPELLAVATLGELRATGHVHRSVKAEIRQNLIARLAAGEPSLPGIVGFDDTVIPEVERALLAGHDIVLLGERGQGKTRLIRTLVGLLDEWTPVIAGCEINEHPVRADLWPVPVSWSRSSATRRPSSWRHRSERYGEKLATPDTSVGDLIGDIDPIKVAEGRTLGDPETVHYGLVPRTNRGIFAVNELPDLAERIQVALLNVLEERDIQVRGYQLRLPLDLLLVASANPEDYTNRGRIITPLKDRFGAEVRTHYPLDLDDELALIAQEAAVLWDPTPSHAAPLVPTHLLEVVARFARAVRDAPQVDQRSGRLGPVRDRRGRDGGRVRGAPGRDRRRAGRGGPGGRPAGRDPGLARQGRVRRRRRGPGVRGAGAPAAPGDRRDLPRPAGRAGPAAAAGEVRRRPARRVRRHRLGGPPARAARHDPGLGRPAGAAGAGRHRRGPAAVGIAAAAVEFALEGLYLNKRLAKDRGTGRSYGA